MRSEVRVSGEEGLAVQSQTAATGLDLESFRTQLHVDDRQKLYSTTWWTPLE